jgi:DNA repair ATPase RecN
MKKYNINQEIPVPPPMPEDTANPVEHMLSSIDHQHEFNQEEKRLDAKIELLRQAVSDLDSHITSAKEMCDRMVELGKVVETGCSKLHEIADYITDLKQQIENMVIPAKITPDSFEEVKKRVNDLIQQANHLLEHHRLLQRQEWNAQNDHLRSVVRENKGIWLSNKVFWWAIGIFEVAVCLAIYFGGNALLSAIR